MKKGPKLETYMKKIISKQTIEKTNILIKFFTSILAKEDLSSILYLDSKHEGDKLTTMDITPETIMKNLLKLNAFSLELTASIPEC